MLVMLVMLVEKTQTNLYVVQLAKQSKLAKLA